MGEKGKVVSREGLSWICYMLDEEKWLWGRGPSERGCRPAGLTERVASLSQACYQLMRSHQQAAPLSLSFTCSTCSTLPGHRQRLEAHIALGVAPLQLVGGHSQLDARQAGQQAREGHFQLGHGQGHGHAFVGAVAVGDLQARGAGGQAGGRRGRGEPAAVCAFGSSEESVRGMLREWGGVARAHVPFELPSADNQPSAPGKAVTPAPLPCLALCPLPLPFPGHTCTEVTPGRWHRGGCQTCLAQGRLPRPCWRSG